jgi:methylenetetrahydrofolate reductase (NADPH)
MESQRRHPRRFSFEFFPPRSPEAQARLHASSQRLAALGPDYFSVTFGAGGSTRERTLETVLELRARTGVPAAPHVSCIGYPLDNIREVLDRYRQSGVREIVALRGDMPSGTVGFGELRHANELVEFIRRETGDLFRVEVACYPEVHPQATSVTADLLNFKRKVEAGADGAITQYFFNADAYFRFVDSCERRGVRLPITPGIMPITNSSQLVRFSEACGAEIPRWILRRLQEFGDDRAAIRAFGIDVGTALCARLLEEGAPGLHFYTLNQAEVAEAIWRNLALGERRDRAAGAARARSG